MSWIERAESQLKAHSTTLHALQAIGALVKRALVDPKSDTFVVIQIIERMTDALIAGFDGKMTSDEVEKHLLELSERLAANDQAADTALDKKFPSGGA